MAELRYLCRNVRGLLLLWLALSIMAAFMEFLTLNSVLPAIWQSDSRIKDIVNHVYGWFGIAEDRVLVAAMVFVAVLYLGRNVFLTVQGIVVARFTTDICMDIKRRLLRKVDGAEYLQISKMDAGVLGNTILHESDRISDALESLVEAVVHGLFAVMVLTLSILLEPYLVAACLLVVVPYYVTIRKIISFSKGISMEQTVQNGRMQSLVTQMLSALEYLKNTESSGRIMRITNVVILDQRRLRYIQRCLASVLRNGTDLVLVLLGLGAMLTHNSLTGEPILESLLVLFVFRRSMIYAMACQGAFRQYLELYGSVDKVSEIDRDLLEQGSVVNPDALAPDPSRIISLQHVSFGYSETTEVLKNVSLTISPGSKVAIVGESGCGKSTLLMLLTGVLKPTDGSIYLGDTPYAALDLPALRSQIGYVSQNGVVFNDSIVNNVSMWETNPPQDRIDRALRVADASGFVEALPEQELTVLGDGGNVLSGGQGQRITIAREVYKEPCILMLDEAMSSLDVNAENQILENMWDAMAGTTVIAVTHRVASTRWFDKICVMENGRLVAQGSYDELYSSGGTFRYMADSFNNF